MTERTNDSNEVAAAATREEVAPDPRSNDWYLDAVVYQLHLKSYYDADNDGIGDFRGLIERLDYVAELGVTAIWLLPFYPSPRRDDGYDIAEYTSVHPDYGTLEDAKRFIDEAHARGLRVITELVINHTSDQHAWFQRARRAPKGSIERDFYVWSDTDQAYQGTRIIFCDTEKSNWTWDDVAGAYYWHRFYSHQPDLNFDNPRVLEEVLAVMKFWLDLGVDGLRLDAVPYLVEREGTNNENLPETHAVLRRIRAALDAQYPDRMLLAEANQWPEDTQEYFGAGDECHMAFHFPLMPRMYMAIAKEDRFPITDIMRQTPAIPAGCQWAIFLRNHDELTLEMVTDAERDYLWEVYASERRARINLGIRRRLAPLLERDRRRIELMTSLLLSMPGTPVIYYGDEIGMGDNIHLGDRDGVRTPMQWSPDRNGGFSRADPERLVLPPIMDPMFGFGAVNVEAQRRDAHSLLNWTRRMVSLRNHHRAFGRGRMRFLYPRNRRVLAYLREHGADTILCVANLARTPQAVELDLAEFDGLVPYEMTGATAFPPIGRLTYLLTLPPFAFFWFQLRGPESAPSWYRPVPEHMPEYATLVLRRGLPDLLDDANRRILEDEALPAWLAMRRWYAARGNPPTRVRIEATLPLGEPGVLLARIRPEGAGDAYLLPLAIAWEDEQPSALAQQLAVARVRRGPRVGLLTDAFAIESFAHATWRALGDGAPIAGGAARLVFERPAPLPALAHESVSWLSAEQSNSSLVLGDTAVVKLLRRAVHGVQPEVEMGRHLARVGYTGTPTLLGEVRWDDGSESTSVALVHAFVRNQGDGWRWTVDHLKRAVADDAVRAVDEPHGDALRGYEGLLAAIARRLAGLHDALAAPSDDTAFAPRPASEADAEAWRSAALARYDEAIAALAAHTDVARTLADARDALEHALAHLAMHTVARPMTRIHGDFHLGQVIVASGDAWIIDFEGEPARPIAERRALSNPLRDVAGLLRSLDYATAVVEDANEPLPHGGEARRAVLLAAFRDSATEAFLRAYRDARATPFDATSLPLFLLEKAAYEVAYEAAHRPAWIAIPARALVALAARLTAPADG